MIRNNKETTVFIRMGITFDGQNDKRLSFWLNKEKSR